MAYRVQLTRYEVQNIQWQYFGAYRMRVEVTAVEGEGLDTNLFIYQRVQPSPYDGSEACDEFQGIAGPAQMASMPALEPDADREWPFYRLPYLELDFTAESLALETWNIILREVAVLCEAMGRYTQLVALEPVWVPDAPEDEGGDSESDSVSSS